MPKTNRKRGARNTTTGNSASPNIKMTAAQARRCGDQFVALLQDGSFTWPQIAGVVTYNVKGEIGLLAAAADSAAASAAGPTAPTRARRTTPAPAARQTRKATTPRAATGAMDLNKAILSVMPDTRPIQQGNLVQAIQAKYPNRWKGNIIGAGLGRFLKAGTLVRQGGTGNKAVWALAHSQQTQAQAA